MFFMTLGILFQCYAAGTLAFHQDFCLLSCFGWCKVLHRWLSVMSLEYFQAPGLDLIRISLFLRWAICFPQNGMEIHSKNVFKAKCQVSARVGWRWEFTEFKKSPCWEHLPKKGPLTKIDRSIKNGAKYYQIWGKKNKKIQSFPFLLCHKLIISSGLFHVKLKKKNKNTAAIFFAFEFTFMVSVGNGRLL